VIKSTAVNNDGSAKVGFTAPSVRGQSAVIAEALALAEVSADTIGYLEAHGTGTALGDPIEVAAATQAFRQTTERRQRERSGNAPNRELGPRPPSGGRRSSALRSWVPSSMALRVRIQYCL
jgi:hypothetical protein